MQAIIRFSIDGDQNSALRNKLAGVLQGAGFGKKANTATWVNDAIDTDGLAAATSAFWTTAHTHTGPGKVDHFWMHSERDFLGYAQDVAAGGPISEDEEPGA